MISESDLILAKHYQRDLAQVDRRVASAVRSIDSKNDMLKIAERHILAQNDRIDALEAALVAERSKTSRLMSQLQRFMAMH